MDRTHLLNSDVRFSLWRTIVRLRNGSGRRVRMSCPVLSSVPFRFECHVLSRVPYRLASHVLPIPMPILIPTVIPYRFAGQFCLCQSFSNVHRWLSLVRFRCCFVHSDLARNSSAKVSRAQPAWLSPNATCLESIAPYPMEAHYENGVR